MAERGQLALERFPGWPHMQVDVLPVVETGAPHFAFAEGEAERLDEV